MTTLRSKDLTCLLGIVHEMSAAPDCGYLRVALAGAARLVPAVTVSYNEMNAVAAKEKRCVIEPQYGNRAALDAAYLANLGQHPLIRLLAAGRLPIGEPVAVSDLVGARALRTLPIYHEFYRPQEVEDQLGVLLDVRGTTQSRLLTFNRSRRGFGARDRAAAAAFVPHLRQAIGYRQRINRLRAAAALTEPVEAPEAMWNSLTPRELEIIGCLGSGATDGHIGRVLGISGRTVGKHLEHIYRKLGVSGRTALAGLAHRRAS